MTSFRAGPGWGTDAFGTLILLATLLHRVDTHPNIEDQ